MDTIFGHYCLSLWNVCYSIGFRRVIQTKIVIENVQLEMVAMLNMFLRFSVAYSSQLRVVRKVCDSIEMSKMSARKLHHWHFTLDASSEYVYYYRCRKPKEIINTIQLIWRLNFCVFRFRGRITAEWIFFCFVLKSDQRRRRRRRRSISYKHG